MGNQILTVDDDMTVRELAKAMLEASGYSVVAASSAKEALALLESKAELFDLCCIILDIHMPDMNGFELLKKLKECDATQTIPIIMLTCQTVPQELEEEYHVGADQYIIKPFTRDQLVRGVSLAIQAQGTR